MKIKKYSKVIETTLLFKKAVQKAKTTDMDKLRKITFLFIRLRMYFMLQAIASLKQYYLKKGNSIIENNYFFRMLKQNLPSVHLFEFILYLCPKGLRYINYALYNNIRHQYYS